MDFEIEFKRMLGNIFVQFPEVKLATMACYDEYQSIALMLDSYNIAFFYFHLYNRAI